ncbi:hypothetical protein M231_07205 [Tremella mesenterica]|uniref:COX assembly mitochondrial protein n=1 Tax=Tremella mesenterica TaxID=5217 RepID=A0A4Q1BCM9_TREME|nr:uncharacterized protein TREMEDRAFT_67023 [Tremella mesenterica DSM 1558]EIW72724.1 hypothetical protein TREMEDRAFT_67023 [Tremella mesenterica DSM 1558]RXK35526.1 hypothetical protein M231_07205 [Tremella mesenterica]
MEALSRREEESVMELAKSQALKACDDLVRAFAHCAEGRTFSLPFACRTHLNAMQGCMREYMTQDRLDDMKLDYIAHRSEKGRQAVEELKAARLVKLKKMMGRGNEV